MGRTLLIFRLTVRDIRRHAAQAVLLVVAVAAATATLTMGLALSGVTSHPYAETRAATKGPDVVAYLTSASQAKSLDHASGVKNYSGPYPVVSATIDAEGHTAGVVAQGRNEIPAAVDQPHVTAGSWVHPGEVVLERTFAESLGVGVGAMVTLNGQSYKVAGVAVTAAEPPYPNLCYFTANSCPPWLQIDGVGSRNVGLAWITEGDALALTSKKSPLTTYVLNLKLAHPADAEAFANAYFPGVSAAGGGFIPPGAQQGPNVGFPTDLMFSTWQGIASADALLVQDAQSVLTPGALLLSLLAIASVAVLVGRRLSEYSRRVGLLKAVGATPAMVAVTFLAENLVLALFAAAFGLVAGWLVAPALTNPGSNLIGSAGAPSLTLANASVVIAVAIVVSLVATLVPAIRASRSSTVAALNNTARPQKRRGVMIRMSGRLPVPMLFGLRLVARRPRRALLSAANIAITVTGIVAVIAFHSDVSQKLAGSAQLTAGGLSDPVINRDEQMLAVITIMLVALAVLNGIFTTWATIVDAKRASALMRALGARARQVSSGLVVAQVLSAIPGALVGVPLGFLLFKAAVKSGTPPPAYLLVLTVIGTLAAMALLTVVPARIGARQPVAEVLRAEDA